MKTNTMKEHVITYSAAMIRARREGRKTQTRRLVNPQPSKTAVDVEVSPSFDERGKRFWLYCGRDQSLCGVLDHIYCPYGQPGDRLVVKEAAWMWCAKMVSKTEVTKKTGKPKVSWQECRNVPPIYCADHHEKPTHVPPGQRQKNGDLEYCWHKKNARFLPRWASRGLDEVVSIRVERLQDISEADAVAEGISMDAEAMAASMSTHPASLAYSALWESINGPGSWALNPWVWVVEFKLIQP